MFWGGCEGRSYVFPILLTTTQLMWIVLFYQAPGQSTPPVWHFFTIFYIRQLSVLPLPNFDQLSQFQQTFSVFFIVAIALVVAPLIYGILLPNYVFPRKWFKAAGVR